MITLALPEPLPAPLTAQTPLRRAPFLVWPVARREFYAAIGGALLLPLFWGIIILGWRALIIILATLGGALIAHLLFRRFTRRGRFLLLSHTLLTALMIAALALPQWPPFIMVCAGALAIFLIWLWGGTGHERLHSALLIAILLPVLLSRTSYFDDSTQRSAIVARDRLFMGDIMAEPADTAAQRWPRSREIAGHDAVIREFPHAVVSELLRRISLILSMQRVDDSPFRTPGLPPPATRAAAQIATEKSLIPAPRTPVDALLDDALVNRLPSIDELLRGIIPGRIGAISAVGILLAGLYLVYRNILRPYSVVIFLFSVLFGFIIITLSARLTLLGGIGLSAIHTLPAIQTYTTLICYEFFSGDILLATVFILAMPGTEPITPRGRRWFLIFAGILAAAAQRLLPALPACTLVLLCLQPLTPLFDYVLARKSWLSYGSR